MSNSVSVRLYFFKRFYLRESMSRGEGQRERQKQTPL